MLGTATWRPAHKDGENDSQTRMLYGEVMVPVDAAPSARIVNFMLQYAITLFDFKAATFTPVDAEAAKGLHVGLQSELVQVVTTPARGPVATSSLPPLYDAISA
ncbi:hypothetical protein EUX98_g4768 [Antrodiella citrinella]|uniref:Uncharacterized protein n=1 Tax=Antrodiella citrinella TaxID=2447956 RepID=A0A4S4MT99_9APHY|nr:hypothetical protein EUX98_g4768 [Antrodiella citrinella]